NATRNRGPHQNSGAPQTRRSPAILPASPETKICFSRWTPVRLPAPLRLSFSGWTLRRRTGFALPPAGPPSLSLARSSIAQPEILASGLCGRQPVGWETLWFYVRDFPVSAGDSSPRAARIPPHEEHADFVLIHLLPLGQYG